MSLQTILRGSVSSSYPLIIFQSSAAGSSLPLLRSLLSQTQTHVILLNLLYPLRALIGGRSNDRVIVVDCSAGVPGFTGENEDSISRLFSAIDGLDPLESVTVVIDSLDTLLADFGSNAAVYEFLTALLRSLRPRSNSRVVLHGAVPSVFPLLPILTTPAFSPSLVHVAAYPPVLLRHMAGSLSTPPPPLSPPEKFWNVFLPVASRTYDVEELVFGNSAEGSGAGGEEIVVELLVRGGEPGEITLGRRKKGVERTLEGWVVSRGAPCELKDLASLKTLFTSKPILNETSGAPDPTQNLSFNLTLTAEQQQSRTQVPLPYAHTGAPASNQQAGVILYDPDSADDIDDDDPDEDLDI